MATDERKPLKLSGKMITVPINQETEEPWRKQYLGDGVYISLSDYGVRLETERQSNGLHWMVLEPQMCLALVNYLKQNNIIEP